MTRRDEIFEVICDYADAHVGNSPSIRDLLQELHRRKYVMGRGTLQVHLIKLRAEGRIDYIDNKMVIVGSRWVAPKEHTLLLEAVCIGPIQEEVKRKNWRGTTEMALQLQRQKGLCYYCHSLLSPGKMEIEHVVPLSRGGEDEPYNLVIACDLCNADKYNRLPHEWPEGGRLC